jgi:peptidoglycan hydrolase-like protein with peptidoglycan-binding domain
MRSRIAFIALLLLAPSFVSAAITSDLRYGSKGPQVSELQQFLIAQNILVGTPTGNFYTITQNGVKTFQRLVGLPQTGFVGPMTRAEINVRLLGAAKASSTPAVSTPTIPAVTASTSPEVAALIAQVQKMLGGTARARERKRDREETAIRYPRLRQVHSKGRADDRETRTAR